MGFYVYRDKLTCCKLCENQLMKSKVSVYSVLNFPVPITGRSRISVRPGRMGGASTSVHVCTCMISSETRIPIKEIIRGAVRAVFF